MTKKKRELSKHWNKTIVHRDEFMKRWDERNGPVELKTPQQLALEKFGTDWHENEGVQPVNDKVLIDLIMCNGEEKKKYLANHWSWHKEQALKIKKWRIHSDEKESQIDKAAKSLSEGVEKLNGVLLIAQQAFDGFKKAAEYIGSLVTDDAKKYREVTPEMLACLSSEFEKTFSIKTKPATETQIGGNHYTKLAIQPMRYSMENGLDPLQHTVIKYVTRFRDKNGIEDLEKAKHCIDMLIEYEKENK